MVISALVGAALGLLAGLGVGGGSLLMLWLTLVQNEAPAVARGINLMFFPVAAGCVSLMRLRKGSLDIKGIGPATLAGCIAAAFCAWISPRLDQQILQTVLGILFIITGLRELFYRPTKAK